MPVSIGGVSEAVAADDGSTVHNHALTHLGAIVGHDAGIQDASAADGHLAAKHAAGHDDCAIADPGSVADHHVPTD